MPKVTVKAIEDFSDRENSTERFKDSEFLVREDYAKILEDGGFVKVLKDKKKEPTAKEKRLIEKREKAIIDQKEAEKKTITKPGFEIVEKVKKPAK